MSGIEQKSKLKRSKGVNGPALAKRGCDLVIALFLAPVWLPIILIGACLIKLEDSGPVFYLGERTGQYGRRFNIIKLRTMVLGAAKTGGDTTARNDPRITRAGKFLRRYKLDEMPQFINVLKGDMSIVGPRPELPYYTDQYSTEEREILSVLPGITDPSSIKYSALDEVVGSYDADRIFEEIILPEKNRLRLEYVRSRSFFGDLLIILKTFTVLFQRLRGGRPTSRCSVPSLE